MEKNKNIIDWSSPDALYKVIDCIKDPLSSIIELSDHPSNDQNNEIILKSTTQISELLNEISVLVDKKLVKLNFKFQPDIFYIYHENEFVQSLCTDCIEEDKISSVDLEWLMNLENEIYESIQLNELNLYELAYKLAVSERQLYRKTKEIVHLTPNKYIRVLKLHKAKKLIEDFVYNSVSQVAYEVGFADVYYFSRIFTQQYGVSPKELMTSL